MLKFKRPMQNMNGKSYAAGSPVPENFSTPFGLAEMVKAGDIEEVLEFAEQEIKPEPIEEIPEEIPVAETVEVKPKKVRKTK